LVGTSLTTNGDGQDIVAAEDILLNQNPHFHFHDERRGYVHCQVTSEELTARFRVVPYIWKPGAPVETRAVFVVDNARPGAIRDA
jgi:alkaline phosphatase D